MASPKTCNLLVGLVSVEPIPTLPTTGIKIVPELSTSNRTFAFTSATRNKDPSLILSFTSNSEVPVEVLAIDNLPDGTEVPIPTLTFAAS
jgi:hypothetical protein